MSMFPGILTVSIDARNADGGKLVAPTGLSTPHQSCIDFSVTGGDLSFIEEDHTGQKLALVTPTADRVVFQYTAVPGGNAYPDDMFVWRQSRFTRAADDLVAEMQNFAANLDGSARVQAIARHAAQLFTYGHPETRFNDGLDEVPMLGCGLTAGSCVDINTWFIAALRVAGIEAGYVTGYFFPEEKGGTCTDMHCWVVTRADGVVQEWDIAHHLKLGRRDIEPALDPKPGWRMAMAHSMGLDISAIGQTGMKLIGEPFWAGQDTELPRDQIRIKWDKSAG